MVPYCILIIIDLFSTDIHVPQYWNESDLELSDDFSISNDCNEPPTPHFTTDENRNEDHEAFIWWVISFSCVFQTLHSISSRAIGCYLEAYFNFLAVILMK